MTVIDKESRHNGAIYIEIKNYLEILSKGGSVIVYPEPRRLKG